MSREEIRRELEILDRLTELFEGPEIVKRAQRLKV